MLDVKIDINNKQNGFYNYFCCPLLAKYSNNILGSEFLAFSEDLYFKSVVEIFDDLNIDNIVYEKIVDDFVSNFKKQNISKCNVLSLMPEITLKVLKKHNISGEIFVRSCDLSKAISEKCGIFFDPYFENDEQISKISLDSAKYNLPLIINLFDGLDKAGELSVRYGSSPLEYLENLGILDRDCSFLNFCSAEKEDFLLLKNYDAKVILTPYNSLNFGQGSAKIFSMLANDVNVKFASPLQNNLQKEVELAQIVARGEMRNADLFINQNLININRIIGEE